MSTHDDTTAFEQWEVVELAASAGEQVSPDGEREAELARLREAARAEGYAEGLARGARRSGSDRRLHEAAGGKFFRDPR